METYIISMNWTDQAIRNIKGAPGRAQYGEELAQKFKVTYHELYMTSGDSDLIAIVHAPDGDSVAKFVLALCSRGNVRTRTCRAWPEKTKSGEKTYLGLIQELPDPLPVPLP